MLGKATKLKVAIYVRKSRDNGEGKEDTLFNQSRSLQDYAQIKGYDYDLFEEVESSLLFDRPELSKMLIGIEQGIYKRIVIVHVDRLGRDTIILNTIAKLCLKNNVLIETPETTYNMNEPATKMMFGFQSVIAEAEMDNIRDRLAKGKFNTVSLRKRHLVSIPPFGYYYDKNDKNLHPNPEQVPVFKLIVELALKGYSSSMIADKLNSLGYKTSKGNNFRPDNILRTLKKRVYLGEGYYNSKRLGKKATAKGCHEPLITEEDYIRIQSLFKSRISKENTKSLGLKSPLNKLLICGVCGKGLTIQKNNKVSKDKQNDLSFFHIRPCRHKLPDLTKCYNGGVKIDKVEKAVINSLKTYRGSLSAELSNLLKNDTSEQEDKLKANLKNLRLELTKKDVQEEKLLDLYLNDKISQEKYDKRAIAIEESKVSLTTEIELQEYKLNQLDASVYAGKVEKAISLIDKFEEMPLDEQHATLRLIIEKIVFTKPLGPYKNKETKIEVHFREL